MVRNLAMTADLDAIGRTVVRMTEDRAVLVTDLAEVAHGVQPLAPATPV